MFTQHLKEYRESGFLSDLTVEVGKQRFRLHKLVMASSSKYFCGLVQSEMSDSNHVSIPELPGGEQSMELVADFCYEKNITNKLNVENIGHLICASHYLQIGSLEVQCLKTLELIARESFSNCCKILSKCEDVQPTAETTGVIDCCVKTLLQCWIGRKPCRVINFEYKKISDIVKIWANELRHVPFSSIVNIMEKQSREFLATQLTNPKLLEIPLELTDQLLWLLTTEHCLSPSDFLSLYRSSSKIPRPSYDAVFKALESLLQFNGMTTATSAMIQEIDFTKLSQQALERASDNSCIPQHVVLKATLSICNDLRKQLKDCKEQLQEQLEAKAKRYKSSLY
jgi:hypothetical protein